MLSQRIIAILIFIPVITLLFPSINYWFKLDKKQLGEKAAKKPKYKNTVLFLLAIGVLFMWIFWIGGIIFLFLDAYYETFGFLMFSTPFNAAIQVVGLIIFYIGAITYNLNIIIAGKYLRPSTSGILDDHRLVKKDPFRIIRHPLYVSYLLRQD